MLIAFTTAFLFLVTILSSISDFDAIAASGNFPLAEIYRQATGTRGGSLGLLIITYIVTSFTCTGGYITAGRMFWTLARDNATPFSKQFGQISPSFHNPFNATLLCGCVCTALGCIYIGSSTAFNAFVSSYVQLSTLSYLMAILPHVLSRRSNVTPGWFWMRGPLGYIVNIVSCLYIIVFVVIFCFPYALPVDAKSMNYTSAITGGFSLFVACWWGFRKDSYVGPQDLVSSSRSRGPCLSV